MDPAEPVQPNNSEFYGIDFETSVKHKHANYKFWFFLS